MGVHTGGGGFWSNYSLKKTVQGRGRAPPCNFFGVKVNMRTYLMNLSDKRYVIIVIHDIVIKVDQDHVQLLQEAFSLLAYADPWASPVAEQLQTKGRESVCHSLNSAILGKF